MANQSLIERTVETSDETEVDSSGVSEIVSEVRVDNGRVEFQTISDDRWNRLCSIKDLAEGSVSNITAKDDLEFSTEVEEKLRELSERCELCFESGSGMFRLDYRTDEDGDLKELVIPLETSISDDVVVQEIHNDDGEFVAQNVEQQIDAEMYELWNIDMYVDEVQNPSTVYIEDGKKTVPEVFNQYIDEKTSEHFVNDDFFNQESGLEWMLKTFASFLGVGILIFTGLTVLNFLGWIGLVGLCVVLYMGMVPLLMVLGLIIQVVTGIEATVEAVRSSGEVSYSEFFDNS